MNPTGEERDRGSGCVSAVDAVSRSSPARDLSLDNEEVDLNSADQLLWRCPQCSYTNDEEISRAVFGDTDEWARVCVICYISCPREVNSAYDTDIT